MSMKLEMTISDLLFKWDYYMCNDITWDRETDTLIKHDYGKAIGFTIGRGKQLHYWVQTSTRAGKYRCHQQYDDHTIGRGRYIWPDQLVTVHFEEKTNG